MTWNKYIILVMMSMHVYSNVVNECKHSRSIYLDETAYSDGGLESLALFKAIRTNLICNAKISISCENNYTACSGNLAECISSEIYVVIDMSRFLLW